MADAKSKKDGEQEKRPEVAAAPQSKNLGVRLAPVNNSDQPVSANYTALNIAPGMVFIDFGFLERAMLTTLPRMVKQGGKKLPETVNGKRAMGYDALQGLRLIGSRRPQRLARQILLSDMNTHVEAQT